MKMTLKEKIKSTAIVAVTAAAIAGGGYYFVYGICKIGTNAKVYGDLVLVQDTTPALARIMYSEHRPRKDCSLQVPSWSDIIQIYDYSCKGHVDAAEVNGKKVLRTFDEKLFEELDKKYNDIVRDYDLENRAAEAWDSESKAHKKLEEFVK